MNIKTKNAKKWRWVYRQFGITQRLNTEDTKKRSQISVMEEKSYLWRDITNAATFNIENLEPNPCLYKFVLAFSPFIVDLTFSMILNIWEESQ